MRQNDKVRLLSINGVWSYPHSGYEFLGQMIVLPQPPEMPGVQGHSTEPGKVITFISKFKDRNLEQESILSVTAIGSWQKYCYPWSPKPSPRFAEWRNFSCFQALYILRYDKICDYPRSNRLVWTLPRDGAFSEPRE